MREALTLFTHAYSCLLPLILIWEHFLFLLHCPTYSDFIHLLRINLWHVSSSYIQFCTLFTCVCLHFLALHCADFLIWLCMLFLVHPSIHEQFVYVILVKWVVNVYAHVWISILHYMVAVWLHYPTYSAFVHLLRISFDMFLHYTFSFCTLFMSTCSRSECCRVLYIFILFYNLLCMLFLVHPSIHKRLIMLSLSSEW